MSFLLISYKRKKHIEFDTDVSSCTLTDHTGGLIRSSPLQTVYNTTACLRIYLITFLDFFPYDVSISFWRVIQQQIIPNITLDSLWNLYWRLIQPVSHTRLLPDGRKTKHGIPSGFFSSSEPKIQHVSISIMSIGKFSKPRRHPGLLASVKKDTEDLAKTPSS